MDKLGFRVEPFLWHAGRLITWADAELSQSLDDDVLPIPSVTWRTPTLTLTVTALADGEPGHSRLLAHYRVRNASDAPQQAALCLALRPFQVLPPWQELNITGGTARLGKIFRDGHVIQCDSKSVIAWTPPDEFRATTFDGGEIVEYLARGQLPPQASVHDAQQLASGALRYELSLPPATEREIVLAIPLHGAESEPVVSAADAAREYALRLEAARRRWRERLGIVEFFAAPAAERYLNTLRSQQAYILINADGPAIQPGSRTYERSWIRDGALTSTALLCTGHVQPVRDFIAWYAAHQYDNGKIPCVVDRRGPDPVPEHDSTGQFIYLVWTCYQFTRERELLERYLPNVVSAVGYLEALRNERLTPEFRDGPPEKRVLYGLLPESISHEGYSAKPMHSYWDGFFALRGFKDAAQIATVLQDSALAERCTALAESYRESLYASMRLSMSQHKIDYIPGCAELGDFDATSTAIGLYPGGELGRIPEPQLANTFARYLRFFRERRDGKLDWRDYTPYEVRLINTFVRLGQPDAAHELAAFFLADQSPPAWNQWGEVVWREPLAPRFVGDMPHTWVGSDFVSAVRTMFLYEAELEDQIVLAAGLKPEWCVGERGAGVRGAPTRYGMLSYRMHTQADETTLELEPPATWPSGGFRWVIHARGAGGRSSAPATSASTAGANATGAHATGITPPDAIAPDAISADGATVELAAPNALHIRPNATPAGTRIRVRVSHR